MLLGPQLFLDSLLYTALPTQIDRRFDEVDEDAAVRPTIIKPGEVWTKRSQAGLISDVKESHLREDDQRKERDGAFDLLDALSRSGTLGEASLAARRPHAGRAPAARKPLTGCVPAARRPHAEMFFPGG